jgi:GxxExxY protein
MELNEITGAVVEKSMEIHRELGPGLLETVYQRVLSYELRKAGLDVESEVSIPIQWEGHQIDQGFRADLIVNKQVLVELKSVETTVPVHRKQVLTYIKLAKLPIGLLINFGEELLKDGIHRLIN